jgi:hypothetical protein
VRQIGWSKRVEVGGFVIEVFADCIVRHRPPKGSEIVRMMSRAQPVSMVRDERWEWVARNRILGSVRIEENPNGTFARLDDRRHVHRTVVEAATAWAEFQIRRRGLGRREDDHPKTVAAPDPAP